jgi:hypothetical protein
MPNTYTLLEKITVGAAGASAVTFTSIPQTYTDLIIKVSTRSNQSNVGYTAIRLNGSITGYSQKILQGDGSTPASYTGSSSLVYALGASTSNNFIWDNTEIYISNYASSNNKSVSIDNIVDNGTTSNSFALLSAGVWANSAAITSIELSAADQTLGFTRVFQQHSTFYLYGVTKLGVTPTSAPKATGGDIIETDGTYWYHAFISSSTFTPKTSLSCDVLVVAGGGSGGWPYSGGGGAGGVIAFASQSISTAQTVTVGGGAAGAYNTGNGVQGSNSVFGSLTAAVGGGGGVGDSTVTTLRNGGSGGGGHPYGRGNPSTDNAGGTATSGQGNAGGLGSPNGSSQDSGGGGGGAGAVGANATTTAAGAGGAGTNSVTNWGALSSVLTTTGLGVSGFIAGGGGGGTNGSNAGAGGSGGGGRGANNAGTQESEAGTANTGSGSGGGAAGNAPASPKNGGSGLVIVRYPI